MILSSDKICLKLLLIASICSSVNSTGTPNSSSAGEEVPQPPRQNPAPSAQLPQQSPHQPNEPQQQSQQQSQLQQQLQQPQPPTSPQESQITPELDFDAQFQRGFSKETDDLLYGLFAKYQNENFPAAAGGEINQEMGDHFPGEDRHQIATAREVVEEVPQIPPHLLVNSPVPGKKLAERPRSKIRNSKQLNSGAISEGKHVQKSESSYVPQEYNEFDVQQQQSSPSQPADLSSSSHHALPLHPPSIIPSLGANKSGHSNRRANPRKMRKLEDLPFVPKPSQLKGPQPSQLKVPQHFPPSQPSVMLQLHHALLHSSHSKIPSWPPGPFSATRKHNNDDHGFVPQESQSALQQHARQQLHPPQPYQQKPPLRRTQLPARSQSSGYFVSESNDEWQNIDGAGSSRHGQALSPFVIVGSKRRREKSDGKNQTAGPNKRCKVAQREYNQEYLEKRNVEIAKIKKNLLKEFGDFPPLKDDVILRLKYDLKRRDILWLEHLLREQNLTENNDSLVDAENSSPKALMHYIKNAEENQLKMHVGMSNLCLEEAEDKANPKGKQRRSTVGMVVKAEQNLLIILPKQFIRKMPRFMVYYAYDLAEIYRKTLEQDYLKMDANSMKTPEHFMPEILIDLNAEDDELPIDIDPADYEKLDPNQSDENHKRYYKYTSVRGKEYAECRICKRKFARTGGSTTGVIRHIKSHPQLFKLFERAKKEELKQKQQEKDKRALNCKQSSTSSSCAKEKGIRITVNLIASKTPNKDGTTKVLGKRKGNANRVDECKDALMANTKQGGKPKTVQEEYQEMKIPEKYMVTDRKTLETYRRTILMLETILLDNQDEIRRKYGPQTIDHYIKNAEGNKQINGMPGEMFELDLKEVKNNRKSRKIQNVSRQAKSKVKPKKSTKYNYGKHLKHLELFAVLPKLYKMQMPKLQLNLILPLAQKYRNNLKGYLEEYLVGLGSDYWINKLEQEDKDKGQQEDEGENEEDDDEGEDDESEDDEDEWDAADNDDDDDDDDDNEWDDDERDDDEDDVNEDEEEPTTSQSRPMMVNTKEVHMTKRRKKD